MRLYNKTVHILTVAIFIAAGFIFTVVLGLFAFISFLKGDMLLPLLFVLGAAMLVVTLFTMEKVLLDKRLRATDPVRGGKWEMIVSYAAAAVFGFSMFMIFYACEFSIGLFAENIGAVLLALTSFAMLVMNIIDAGFSKKLL